MYGRSGGAVGAAEAGRNIIGLSVFAWQVLDTLASEAAVESTGGVFAVRFTMSTQVGATGTADDTAGADR